MLRVPTALGLLAGFAVGSAAAEAPADLRTAFYAAWLGEVAPLMRPAEREAFESLAGDAERDAFVHAFWRLRDPTPGTGRNELRDRWQSAAADRAAEEARGPDQQAVLRLLGARPRLLHALDCPPLPRMEVWYYSRDWAPPLAAGAGAGEPFYLLFARDPREDTFRRISPADAGLPWDGGPSLAARLDEVLRRGRCVLGAGAERAVGDLELAFARALTWEELTAQAGVPAPRERWFEGLAAAPDAALLASELHLAFPGGGGEATVVQGLLRLALPSRAGAAGLPPAGLVLAGEVFRPGEIVETFRYAFHGLSADESEGVALRFERHLRPGRYGLRLGLESPDGDVLWTETRAVEVPDGDPPLPAAAGTPAARATPALRLQSPGPGLLVGEVPVRATLSGAGRPSVRFFLDGRPAGEVAAPPFEARVELGERPRRHTLRAVAVDAGGRAVAEDRLLLNAGPHRFAVRLAAPPRTGGGAGAFTARADVDLPTGGRLDRLELEVNGEPRATLYDPPLVQALRLPEDEEVVFVRAVAHLTDGRSAEDVVLLRGGPHGEEVDVQLVELYTTVLDAHGDPVADLDAPDFAVYDEGERQALHGFRKLEEIPVHLCLAVDVSSSMAFDMDTVRASALSFFEQVLTPKDRAALLAFDHRAWLAAPLTADLDDLARSAEDLRAEGGTALYDGLLTGLHYLGGLEGKRALVLLSDGRDVHSRFRLADVQEYARRAGVAIYSVALGTDRRLRPLRRLARETGGRSYTLRRASELPGVYEEIERELRAQYLLTYQAPEAPEGARETFRRVEVRVARPGIEARTLAGYYPE